MARPDSDNIAKLYTDLKERRIEVSSLPVVLYVESVYGCPYCCVMCEVRETMPRPISRHLLERLEPLYPHLFMLAIHGDGEPLLGKEIDYYIGVARDNNIVLHMNTTGFFLLPDLIDKLLQVTLSIRFSVHAGTEMTYKKIMGHDLAIVKENIRRLIKRNSEIGNSNNEFWLSFIVMKENIGEIPAFMTLAHEIGIRHVRFMRLYANRYTLKGVTKPNSSFTFYHSRQYNPAVRKEFLRMLPEIRGLAQKFQVTVEAGDLFGGGCDDHSGGNDIVQKVIKKLRLGRITGDCAAPWVGGCFVRYTGDVFFCCSTPYVIGNLFKDDFLTIWNSRKTRRAREIFRKKMLMGSCGSCRTIRLEEYPAIVSEEFRKRLWNPAS